MDDASSLCREASRFDRSCRELLERRRINKLPVVVDGRVVGIFTDRDLRDAFPSLLETLVPPRRHPRKTGVDPEEILVEDVMTPNVITLALQDTVDEAARIMRRARIGAVLSWSTPSWSASSHAATCSRPTRSCTDGCTGLRRRPPEGKVRGHEKDQDREGTDLEVRSTRAGSPCGADECRTG
jgi:hypothetical protein